MNKPKLSSIRIPLLGELILSGGRPVIAVFLALFVSAIIIYFLGVNPIAAYTSLLKGAVGSIPGMANTCVRASPLLLGGIAVAIGFKGGLLNVGVDGQLYAGAAASTVVGLISMPVPPWLHLIITILAGFLGGALWALIPAYLRAYRGVSEVVVTLMLNYVAIYFVSWLVHEPALLFEEGASFPQSPLILPSAQLPILIGRTSLHSGIILGVVMAFLMYLLIRFTPFGFRTRMVGENPEASRYAGINVKAQTMMVLMVSGGFGGLAGAIEILGLKHRLFDMFSGGVGYEAIAVALLANANLIGVIIAAFFFGVLKAGASKMQIVVGIEASMSLIIQALAVIFVIALGLGGSRMKKRRRRSQKNITITETIEDGD